MQNQLVLAFENYKYFPEAEFHRVVDDKRLHEDLINFITLALQNQQMMKIYQEDGGIIIEYDYYDPSMTDMRLEWVNDNSN